MPKKKKLETLTQTDAKEEKFVPTTLDQIWGDTGLTKYGTMDEEEYKRQIDEMTKSDLATHARKMGFVPNDNRDLLVRKLMSEFRSYTSAFKASVPLGKREGKMSSEVQKILSEGR